jgi:phosphate transport system protein
MAESAQRMVREALDAFVGGDPERAQQVIESDRLVDAYYAQISGDLLAAMMQDTKRVYA